MSTGRPVLNVFERGLQLQQECQCQKHHKCSTFYSNKKSSEITRPCQGQGQSHKVYVDGHMKVLGPWIDQTFRHGKIS